MTRTGGHGVPGCQLQVFSHTSQRKSQALLACLMSSRNAPQRGHCAMKVDARYVDRSGAGARLAPALGGRRRLGRIPPGRVRGPPGSRRSERQQLDHSLVHGGRAAVVQPVGCARAGTGAGAVTGATGSGG